MAKRIAAILFIFCSTSVAWFILGGTICARTAGLDARLKPRVASLWGEAQEQAAPRVSYCRRADPSAKPAAAFLPLAASRVRAALDLEYRQKGLLWYSTYRVASSGLYRFENDSGAPQEVTIHLPLPAARAVYDDLLVEVDGQPAVYANSGGSVSVVRHVEPGAAIQLRVGYRSLGLDAWRYSFGKEVARVRDFELTAATNFRDLDFEANTLAPNTREDTPGGAVCTWRYANLLAGSGIAIAMPEKLQPGPLAGEISFFAPVSLLFFFFVMFLATARRGVELHPMNYFFLAAAFFAFHLLLAYLADHLPIHAAFAVCSLVSVFLVVSYLRLVAGIRFAAVEAGMAQLVYLVLFSYAFFFRGYTGLAVTTGAIVTLFLAMQLTGRIRWSEKFRPAYPAPR
jgi:hypothetical protein